MFQNEILSTQSQFHITFPSFLSYHNQSISSDLDLQYQIYSKYIHLSKQQFAIQQLIAIKDSQTLIQSFTQNYKIQSPKDASSTIDSLCYDQDFQNSLIQQFSSIQRRSPKKITRKGTRHSALKPLGRAGQQFHQILSEIERNCTQKTFNVVKSLLNEHKKNLSKIIQIQKKQKNIRKMQEKTEKVQQQNLIFKMKLNQIEQKIKSKDQQIKSLKQKLSQIKSIDKQNIRSPQKTFSSVTSITKITYDEENVSTFQIPQNTLISTYLDKRQLNINQRMTKVQQIQTRIQNLIENAVLYRQRSQQGCNKCCQMIKKIKDSVMNYRSYLEQEGQQCQKLYNMLKTEVETCLKEKRIQSINV